MRFNYAIITKNNINLGRHNDTNQHKRRSEELRISFRDMYFFRLFKDIYLRKKSFLRDTGSAQTKIFAAQTSIVVAQMSAVINFLFH